MTKDIITWHMAWRLRYRGLQLWWADKKNEFEDEELARLAKEWTMHREAMARIDERIKERAVE